MTVQEQRAVTAWPPDSPGAEGIRSLELRWIFPGQLPEAVARWFGRFPAEVESRRDADLVEPSLRGLSVKVRGGGPFEVKAYRDAGYAPSRPIVVAFCTASSREETPSLR